MTPRKNVADIPRRTKSGRLTTSISLSPLVRELIDRAAQEQSTSFSGLIEMLVIKHCCKRGLIAKEEAMSRS
jgi:hypothetical protein